MPRSPSASRAAILALLALTITLVGAPGCRTQGPTGPNATPLPSYQRLADAQNARVDLLGRLWARTIVSVHYVDTEGKPHYEQGDGHIMRRDFDKIAVDVTKLGQVFFWFGANEDLYWLIDLSNPDHTVAYVGQLDLVTLDKAARASLPIPPLEYMTLAGLATLPAEAAAATISETDSGAVQLDLIDRGFSWRYTFDPVTLLPSRISILDVEKRPVITADLSQYRTVDLTGVGVNQPRAPGRIAVTHLPTETSITLTIDGDIIDGRRSNKPSPAAFDFDELVRAYAPSRIIDLDKPEQLAPAEQTP
jgi:hypothetical protein